MAQVGRLAQAVTVMAAATEQEAAETRAAAVARAVAPIMAVAGRRVRLRRLTIPEEPVAAALNTTAATAPVEAVAVAEAVIGMLPEVMVEFRASTAEAVAVVVVVAAPALGAREWLAKPA